MATETKKYMCDICGEIYDLIANAEECENNHAQIRFYQPIYSKGAKHPKYIDIQFYGNINDVSPKAIRYQKIECE